MAALALAAQVAAWALTEWRGPLIKVKPFNCAPCLTFWFTFLLFGVGGTILEAAPLFNIWCVYAPIYAFINFFYIKTKIQIYE